MAIGITLFIQIGSTYFLTGPKVHPAELRTAEVRPAEVHPAELRTAEVHIAEVRPAKVRPAQVGPAPASRWRGRPDGQAPQMSERRFSSVPFRTAPESLAQKRLLTKGRPHVEYSDQ